MCRSKRISNDHSFVRTSRAMLAGCLLLVVGLGFSAASGAAEPRQGNALAAVSTYRTIVAHELTHFRHQRYDEYYDPKISGDGSRIVYYTFDRPNGHEYLYLANFDGSATQLLKDRVNGARSYYGIQISNNGGRIVMFENYVVWVFQPGGPAPFSYVPFEQTTVLDSFIMNGNGGQIYFVISNDRTLQPIGLFVPRGVYRMNYDGTGVQRIISPENLANASGEDLAKFASLTIGLSVSQDGARLALSVLEEPGRTNAWLFAYDGQLRLLRPKGPYSGILVSSDGSTLVANGGSSNPNTYVMSWGGMEVRVVPGETNCSQALQVTGNGRQFLMDCQGSPMIQVATGTRELYLGRGSFQIPLNALMAGGMVRATMSSDGKRFAFNTNDPNNYNQVATAEVNPPTLGEAPQISNPALNPAFLQSQFGSTAELSFNVVLPANTGRNIGTGATYQGQDVSSISFPSWHEEEPSGSYSSTLAAGNALSGFYTYRIVADIMALDSRRHAAAVYFGPLTVDAAPPASAAINYSTGKPGSYFTVAVSGFPPGQSVRAAVNGATLSNSLWVDEDGKLVFYLSSGQAQPGKYLVAINTNAAGYGLQSAGASVLFTLSDSAPERPLAGIQPVFIVPAGLELHERYLPLVLRSE
jgi:hypothetical protein